MTLALLVAFGTLITWIAILVVRWLNVRPTTTEDSTRAAFAAAGFSGAAIGGGYPILWAMLRNLGSWWTSSSTSFTFTGNLPPGVDEDDLLIVLVIGMLILLGQAVAEVGRAVRRIEPR